MATLFSETSQLLVKANFSYGEMFYVDFPDVSCFKFARKLVETLSSIITMMNYR